MKARTAPPKAPAPAGMSAKDADAAKTPSPGTPPATGYVDPSDPNAIDRWMNDGAGAVAQCLH